MSNAECAFTKGTTYLTLSQWPQLVTVCESATDRILEASLSTRHVKKSAVCDTAFVLRHLLHSEMRCPRQINQPVSLFAQLSLPIGYAIPGIGHHTGQPAYILLYD